MMWLPWQLETGILGDWWGWCGIRSSWRKSYDQVKLWVCCLSYSEITRSVRHSKIKNKNKSVSFILMHLPLEMSLVFKAHKSYLSKILYLFWINRRIRIIFWRMRVKTKRFPFLLWHWCDVRVYVEHELGSGDYQGLPEACLLLLGHSCDPSGHWCTEPPPGPHSCYWPVSCGWWHPVTRTSEKWFQAISVCVPEWLFLIIIKKFFIFNPIHLSCYLNPKTPSLFLIFSEIFLFYFNF